LHFIQSAYPSLYSFFGFFLFFFRSIVSRLFSLKQTHQNLYFLF
jgi:hypothetical protein